LLLLKKTDHSAKGGEEEHKLTRRKRREGEEELAQAQAVEEAVVRACHWHCSLSKVRSSCVGVKYSRERGLLQKGRVRAHWWK
jgi:hypothetical protein